MKTETKEQELKDSLSELSEQEGLQRTKLSELSQQIKSVKMQLWEVQSGFKIGEDVLVNDRKKGDIKAKITSLYLGFKSAHPNITLYKKDGTIGARETYYSADKIKKIV